MWHMFSASRAAVPTSQLLTRCRGLPLGGGRFARFSTAALQKQTQRAGAIRTAASASFAGGNDRAFGQFQIYKGRGAMALVPIRPTWRQLPNGGISMERQGTILLEFAPSTGERTYDWANKLTFAMNVTEIGTVLELPDKSNEFFHDPNKGSNMEGQMQKVLRVEPTPSGDGYFFSVNVNNKPNGIKSSVSVPVSTGEFAVIKRLWEYVIPHLVGFDEVFNCRPQVLDDPGLTPGGYAASPGSYASQYSPPATEPWNPQPTTPAEAASAADGAWEDYQEQVMGDSSPDEPLPYFQEQEELEPEEPFYYQPSPDSADFQPPAFENPSPPTNAFGSRPPF